MCRGWFVLWCAAVGVVGLLSCAAPATPAPKVSSFEATTQAMAAAATAVTWTPEPWGRTATAEIITRQQVTVAAATVLAGVPLTSTVVAAVRLEQAQQRYEAAVSWVEAGDLGLALEEARQALAQATDHPEARSLIAQLAPEATRIAAEARAAATAAVLAARAEATTGAVAERTAAAQATAVARTSALRAQDAQRAAQDAARPATSTARSDQQPLRLYLRMRETVLQRVLENFRELADELRRGPGGRERDYSWEGRIGAIFGTIRSSGNRLRDQSDVPPGMASLNEQLSAYGEELIVYGDSGSREMDRFNPPPDPSRFGQTMPGLRSRAEALLQRVRAEYARLGP
jgi:hypothetical protein